MKSPLVSIIIPTFNRANVLKNAIFSVLTQTYQEFELLVVNDGSRDETIKTVEGIDDPRLTLISQSQSGVSAARNSGVKNSSGSFIAFLDSDDIWQKEKLKKQITFLEQNPELSILQTEEIWIRHGKRVNPKNKHLKPSGDIFPESLHLCTITPSSVIMTRELFDDSGGFDESMPACEDYDLWLRITCDHKIGLLREKLLTRYGGHEDQLSFKYPAMDRFRIYSLAKILFSNHLNTDQITLVKKVLIQKSEILLMGVKKRNPERTDLIAFLDDMKSLRINADRFAEIGKGFLLSNRYFAV